MAALSAVALVTACGSGEDAASSAASAPAADAVGGAAEPAAPGDLAAGASSADQSGGSGPSEEANRSKDAGGSGAAGQDTTLSDAAAAPRRVIRTGQLTVEVDILATSAARVRQTAVDAGGFVASEATGSAEAAQTVVGEGGPQSRPAGRGESVLVLRVPEARFTTVLDAVAAVGQELSRSTSAQDVTGQVADLTSRTQTARASVDRVRALLADAEDLEDVVLLESELTRRQADLDAYQARLTALSGQADLATITAVLRTPDAITDEPNAFVRGVRDGWQALLSSTAAMITVVGALLPFALLIALVAVPLWRWRRRRGRGEAPAAPPGPGSSRPSGGSGGSGGSSPSGGSGGPGPGQHGPGGPNPDQGGGDQLYGQGGGDQGGGDDVDPRRHPVPAGAPD